MVDWKSLPAFLAVARAGSLRGAAEQLDGTPATVRRQVEGLRRSWVCSCSGAVRAGWNCRRRVPSCCHNWSKVTREGSAAAYVPLSFDPGEACQVDWSHEVVILDGVTTTVKVAPLGSMALPCACRALHVRLSHSRMPFVRAYPPETQGPRHWSERQL